MRRFFGAAAFALRFALFAIVRLFPDWFARRLLRFVAACLEDFFLAAGDDEGEDVGINGAGLDDVGVSAAIESFGLIPNSPAIGFPGLLLSVFDIRFSESRSRCAQDRATRCILPEKLLLALDKHRLTKRLRFIFAHSCDATCKKLCARRGRRVL